MSGPSYIGIHDVESMLGLSRATVMRRIADGTLPCRKIGGKLIFDPREIEAAIKRLPTSRVVMSQAA